MSQELEQLGLSTKVREALVGAGLDSIEKLVDYGVDNPYTAIANIGEAGAAEIKQAIAAHAENDATNNTDDDKPNAGDTDAGGELLDPNEPGISPGERGRREQAILRKEIREELKQELAAAGGAAIPVDDPVTTRAIVASRKSSFNRGEETYTPPNQKGKTEIAKIELYGECDQNYFVDAIAGGNAYLTDESVIEVDGKGNRISPGNYVARLAKDSKIGETDRTACHVIGRIQIPNHRIPPDEIVGMLKNRTLTFYESKSKK